MKYLPILLLLFLQCGGCEESYFRKDDKVMVSLDKKHFLYNIWNNRIGVISNRVINGKYSIIYIVCWDNSRVEVDCEPFLPSELKIISEDDYKEYEKKGWEQ